MSKCVNKSPLRKRVLLVRSLVVSLLALTLLTFIRNILWVGTSHSRIQNSPFLFQDATAESGIEFTYRNGEEAGHYSPLEALGGGVALLDFDGDGMLDVLFAGGGSFAGTETQLDEEKRLGKTQVPDIHGRDCKLYKNLGNFRFEDVTKKTGLEQIDFYNHGCAVADYDRDGWPDLLITGYGRMALFHNESVDPQDASKGRKFRDVTVEAGLLPGNHRELTAKAHAEGREPAHHFWSTSAAWADLDGDGFPDLYVCQYVNWSFANHPRCEGFNRGVARDICPPKRFDAMPHAVWRNNGNGTFTNASKSAGLRMPREEKDYDELKHLSKEAKNRLRVADQGRGVHAAGRARPRDAGKEYGKGVGVIILDVDGDGRPDIFVANDTTDSFLYLNRSRPGEILLEEDGMARGVAVDGNGSANGSHGVAAGDLDRSGWPSLFVTNYEDENHGLYRNFINRSGLHHFLFATKSSGIQAAFEQKYVGFGTGLIDLDNDGWEDIFISNGHLIRNPVRAGIEQPPILLKNHGSPPLSTADRKATVQQHQRAGRGLFSD